MKKFSHRLAVALVVTLLMSAALVASAYWFGNKPVEAVQPAEIDERYAKALQWLKVNEAHVLADQNPALWWMLQTAAERTNERYLLDLARRSVLSTYGTATPAPPWKRIIEPKAEVRMGGVDLYNIASYQRFFYHAVTCVPVQIPDEDTTAYLEGKVCPSMAYTVLRGDPACSTHHLMGLNIFKKTGCQAPNELAPLELALVEDIAVELQLDPVMKDAYIQRVLMLAWQGHSLKIKQIWLRRVLDAQEPDGGWLGHRRMPEWPQLIQPWHWREHLSRYWPQRFKPEHKPLDFHATAQGVLLLSLLKSQEKSITP